ncbi:Uncharacterized conserved protein [Phaffia rhodozyma]|uniref:Uncharacterized conserved protein n=1 Tax=Phaffia rhodozyma TaxID=264483 RepID=A0A0F7SQA6_PHARH|nr:Uncharacterized conserved protein [Phaffia rhodozyma]
MSNAHRPTWNPAQGRESKSGSQQVSNKEIASHTKLKFRQPGQTSTSDVARVDLRTQLLINERKAEDKKRKARGLPALPPLVLPGQELKTIQDGSPSAEIDEQGESKRRKLEEAVGLDRDDDDADDDNDDDSGDENDVKGKDKATPEDSDEDEDSDVDSDDDSEDETAELLRELEKIKRERAEEKERQEAALQASEATDREAEIAMGNPLLNLAAALGQNGDSDSVSNGGSSASGFKVGRRWDDDLIFKNQAAGTEDKNKKKEFVNDLLRTDFHRKFMSKFIK